MLDISGETIDRDERAVHSKEDLRDAIRKASRNGRISCATAHTLADNMGVAVRVIGEIVQEEDLKVTHCELGCF